MIRLVAREAGGVKICTNSGSNVQKRKIQIFQFLLIICFFFFPPQVYYITCPETTINFARFPATPTAKEVTLIEPATGKCVENAEEVGTPTYLCKGDGKWYLPTGSCKCKPGYQPDFNKKTCNGERLFFNLQVIAFLSFFFFIFGFFFFNRIDGWGTTNQKLIRLVRSG